MRIRLKFQVFIILLMFLFNENSQIYSLMLLFIIIHEVAHIIAGVCLEFKIRQVKLNILGFNILLEKSQESKFDNFIIAIAGPLSNFAIAIVTLCLPIENMLKIDIVYANILLMMINLLPIYPLDGGRILSEIIARKYDKLKVMTISEIVSYSSIIAITALSSLLVLYYKNFAILIGVAFLWYLVVSERRKNKYRRIAYEIIKKQEKRAEICS